MNKNNILTSTIPSILNCSPALLKFSAPLQVSHSNFKCTIFVIIAAFKGCVWSQNRFLWDPG